MIVTERKIEDAATYLLEQQIRMGFKIWHFKHNHELQNSYSSYHNFSELLSRRDIMSFSRGGSGALGATGRFLKGLRG